MCYFIFDAASSQRTVCVIDFFAFAGGKITATEFVFEVCQDVLLLLLLIHLGFFLHIIFEIIVVVLFQLFLLEDLLNDFFLFLYI